MSKAGSCAASGLAITLWWTKPPEKWVHRPRKIKAGSIAHKATYQP
jgi:hypothetical protein